jgi:hypothetical protein
LVESTQIAATIAASSTPPMSTCTGRVRMSSTSLARVSSTSGASRAMASHSSDSPRMFAATAAAPSTIPAAGQSLNGSSRTMVSMPTKAVSVAATSREFGLIVPPRNSTIGVTATANPTIGMTGARHRAIRARERASSSDVSTAPTIRIA